MKKTLLLLLVLASVANAAPRFGIIGEQENGVGAFITDDMYNAQVTFATRTSDTISGGLPGAGDDESISKITLGGNYKVALDSVTALTVGVSYQILSGYAFDSDVVRTSSEFDTANIISINTGFERALSSNIVLTTQASIYTATSIEYKGVANKVTASSLFTDGRVGVAYLF